MIKYLLKTVVILAIVLLTCIIAVGCTLYFKPQLVLKGIQSVTGYQIDAPIFEVGYQPLQIYVEDLSITTNDSDQPLFTADLIDAELSITKLYQKQIKALKLKLIHGRADLRSLASHKNHRNQSQKTENQSPQHIHSLLALAELNINDLQVIIDEQRQLNLAIEQHSDTDNATQINKPNAISYHIHGRYQDAERLLPIDVSIQSWEADTAHHLSIMGQQLDLTPWITEATPETTESQQTLPHQTDHSSQQSINWEPILNMSSSVVRLTFEQITLNDNKISDIDITLAIDKSIEFKPAALNVHWQLAEDLWLNEQLHLTGKITPNLAKNLLDVNLNLNLTNTDISLTGTANANAPANHSIKTKIRSNGLALINNQHLPAELLTNIQPFMPLNLEMILTSDINSEFSNFDFSDIKLLSNHSDLNGQLNLNINGQERRILGDLYSNQVKYLPQKEANNNQDSSNAVSTSKTLLSNEKIDWSWLDNIYINASYKAKQLQYGDYFIGDLTLPINVNEQTLDISPLSANFGEGSINSKLNIQKQTHGASLNLELAINDSQLAAYQLINTEHLKGGMTNGHLQVQTYGESIADFGANSNGRLLFELDQATVGNDAFELLGSDVFLEILNKLNPFAKRSPTTELDCAVVHVNIVDGVMRLKNSLAIQTEKIAIVGDGNINLNNERISLNLSPTSRQGIGVNAGSLIKLMKIGGTLKKPRPATDAEGVLKTTIALGAAISSGGLSVAADGLFSRARAGNVCEKARNAFDKKTSDQQQKQTQVLQETIAE